MSVQQQPGAAAATTVRRFPPPTGTASKIRRVPDHQLRCGEGGRGVAAAAAWPAAYACAWPQRQGLPQSWRASTVTKEAPQTLPRSTRGSRGTACGTEEAAECTRGSRGPPRGRLSRGPPYRGASGHAWQRQPSGIGHSTRAVSGRPAKGSAPASGCTGTQASHQRRSIASMPTDRLLLAAVVCPALLLKPFFCMLCSFVVDSGAWCSPCKAGARRWSAPSAQCTAISRGQQLLKCPGRPGSGYRHVRAHHHVH